MTTDELRQAIELLPPITDNPERFTWEFRQQDLRDKILKEDPSSFLTWPVIKETMFVGNAPYIDNISIPASWWKKIKDPGFGAPEFYNGRTSGNYIVQAGHLHQWQEVTGKRISSLKSIIEFGGGYGAMAVICRRLGFLGKYIIVDLPEFSLLQQYYLSNTVGLNNTILTTDKEEVSNDYDLLISVCSLSEVSFEIRNRFLDWLKINHHLVVFQPAWDGRNNTKYFVGVLGGKMFSNKSYKNHWYLAK